MLTTDGLHESRTLEQPRLLSKYAALMDLALRLGDLLVIVGAGVIAWYLRFGTWNPSHDYKVALATTVLYAVICFWMLFPLYRSWRGRPVLVEVAMLGLAWSGVFLLFSVHALAFKTGDDFSRLWLGQWYLLAFLGLAAGRVAARRMLGSIRRRGLDVQKIVVVGLRTPVVSIQNYLRDNPWVGMEVTGYFATTHDMVRQRDSGLRCLGEPQDLALYLSQESVDQVWIALPLSARSEIKDVLATLNLFPVRVKLIPDLFDVGVLNQSVEQIGTVPVLNLRDGNYDGYRRLAKAFEDKLVAAIAIVALAPLLLAIAIGVKLSSKGPVLFRQPRQGLDGRIFHILKFRSMVVHEEPGGIVTQASIGDSRITRFGAFLRRTSLDELPQFFNVLGGSMSVVGPRPHAIQHNDFYRPIVDRYMQRHFLKPGITGWAQVNGLRGETNHPDQMRARVQYDIDYVRHWSLWLDVKIIVMTAFKVLGQKSAY